MKINRTEFNTAELHETKICPSCNKEKRVYSFFDKNDLVIGICKTCNNRKIKQEYHNEIFAIAFNVITKTPLGRIDAKK